MNKYIQAIIDRNTRYAAMASRGFFDWMSDEVYLKLEYKHYFQKKLDLRNPKTFSEKLQWLKINDRNIKYVKFVDKYEAKKEVANILGRECIVPTYGVYEHFEDIDFDTIPKQFVMKCTHDSGGLFICRDKNELDKRDAKEKLEKCLHRDYSRSNREWPYHLVKPRILVEKYLEEMDNQGIRDYKFFVFNGVSKFVYVSEGLENHETAKMSFLDLEGKPMPFHRSDYREFEKIPQLPNNFDLMIAMADKLAQHVSCPFVRIDLYSISGRIYFSEVTFSPCGGFMLLSPAEWDAKLGDMLKI